MDIFLLALFFGLGIYFIVVLEMDVLFPQRRNAKFFDELQKEKELEKKMEENIQSDEDIPDEVLKLIEKIKNEG